jgi:hypothetical protein
LGEEGGGVDPAAGSGTGTGVGVGIGVGIGEICAFAVAPGDIS